LLGSSFSGLATLIRRSLSSILQSESSKPVT
jgi:hypothetical protein